MPTLDFKGKSFVHAHHLSVPFRELVIDAKKSLPVKGQKPGLEDNLIIHGDNLLALKALLPVYAGKVVAPAPPPPHGRRLGSFFWHSVAAVWPYSQQWGHSIFSIVCAGQRTYSPLQCRCSPNT
jgi:hypothetical protein